MQRCDVAKGIVTGMQGGILFTNQIRDVLRKGAIKLFRQTCMHGLVDECQ